MNYQKSEDESSKVESWVHQTVNVNLSSENIFLKPSESIDAFGKKNWPDKFSYILLLCNDNDDLPTRKHKRCGCISSLASPQT